MMLLRGVRRRRLLFICLAGGLGLLWVGLWLWPKSALTAPPATALYVDRHGSFLCESDRDRIGFWDISQNETLGAERIAAAMIAIEDKRFDQHGGVDLRAIGRALRHNLGDGPRQGASTLAMQVARMQQNHRQRGYLQKIEEMALAWIMTQRHGRAAMLHHYLKLVPQGNRIHGVSYAARRFFHKPIDDLSWAEAAVLAALPKAPGRMNLYRAAGRKSAAQRARRVLALLREQGTLNPDEHQLALHALDGLRIPIREVRPFNAYHAILRLKELPTQSDYEGPVVTTLDLKHQDEIDRRAYPAIERWRKRGAGNIAVVLADRRQGDILAYLGSDFYSDLGNAGAIDYANTRRSSGSTLKPFIYALGMEDGHFDAGSVLDDLPLNLTYQGGHYTARNYDSGYLGPMLYRRALANSRNIPALSVLRRVGLHRTHERLRLMGLGDPEEQAEHYGLGLAIGGMYVTLEELVGAYGVLANDGFSYKTRWLRSAAGGPGESRIFPSAIARQVTGFLSDNSARLPGFPHLAFRFPVALKTGTSQGYRDGWALCYSAEYILGIWVGHPDHEPMNQLGGSDVAGLAREIMEGLHPEQARGLLEQPFPAPEDHELVAVCPLSGALATPHCDQAQEYFPRGRGPQEPSLVHQPFAVDKSTGARATATSRAGDVTVRHAVILPARFASWGSSRGYGPPSGTPTSHGRALARVRSPVGGERFRIDPDMPSKFQTLALKAVVEPSVPEVVWYVNGKPWRTVPYPYVARWQMAQGEYQFQVRFPNAAVASEPVSITVN